MPIFFLYPYLSKLQIFLRIVLSSPPMRAAAQPVTAFPTAPALHAAFPALFSQCAIHRAALIASCPAAACPSTRLSGYYGRFASLSSSPENEGAGPAPSKRTAPLRCPWPFPALLSRVRLSHTGTNSTRGGGNPSAPPGRPPSCAHTLDMLRQDCYNHTYIY